jgi:hypothetical protein
MAINGKARIRTDNAFFTIEGFKNVGVMAG